MYEGHIGLVEVNSRDQFSASNFISEYYLSLWISEIWYIRNKTCFR